MTVAEMIAKLQAMIAADPSVAELPVDSEGCDCTEEAVDVREYGPNRRVLVARGLPR